MPLISEAEEYGIPQDRLGTPIAPDTVAKPDALDVAAASLRQSSLVGGAYETAIEGGFKTTPPQAGYDPLDDIDGYEEFAPRFLSSRSPQETATIKQRIQSDLADRRTLGQAGGWGIAASMAAGISDPINLAFAAIPIAGAGRVAGLVKGAVGGALVETPIQLAQESLHPAQTREESILNVGTAAILTGILGSAVSRSVPRGTFEKAAETLAKDTAPFEGSTAGAAAVGFGTTLEQEGVGTGGGLIAKTLGQGSPLTRMLTSPTKSTRVLAQKLADIPYVLKKNESGIATGTSVEKRIEQYNGLRVTDIQARDDAYLTYRDAAKKAGNQVLAREEFSTQVAAAMRRGDAHSIPEIAAEAARTRKTIIDPITKEAQNFGLLPDPVKLRQAELDKEAVDKYVSAQTKQLYATYSARVKNAARQKGLTGVPTGDAATIASEARFTQASADLSVGVERQIVSEGTKKAETALAAAKAEAKKELESARKELAATERRPSDWRQYISRTRAARDTVAEAEKIRDKAVQAERSRAQGAIETHRGAAQKNLEALGATSLKDFRTRAERVATGQETDSDPVVNELAQLLKKSDRGELKKVAPARETTRTGFNVLGAKSYLPRLYNVPKIKAHLSDWNARGADWLVSQGTDPAEAKAIMDEYTNKVLGTTRGFVDLDPSVVVKTGPLRERTVNIPDEILEPYLHSNIERVVGQYLHTVAPQIELARGLGVDEANPSIAQAFENEVNRIKDEYAILKNRYLKPTGVTERLTAKLSTREAEAEYNALKDTRGGKVLSVDAARELSPDYLKNRTLSADVHEPASAFIKRQYAKKLAEAPKAGEEPEVIFNAGGTGAGKTTGLDLLKGEADHAQIIYDTNMDSFGSSVTKIEQALKAGKAVKILYTFRDPLEALRKGALTRAMRQEGTFGSGRTVPLESHIKTHKGSRATVEKLIEKYHGDERVQIRVIDNSRGRGNAVVSSLEKLPGVDYTQLREKALQVLDEEHAAGRISEPVYQGFKQGERGPSGSGVRGEPQSQRDARAADKTVAALTDREKADIRDAVAMRDRVLGKYGIPEDPDSMIVRGARLMRTYTYVAKGGGFVLASFGDIGRIVTRYGMRETAAAVAKFSTRLANWGATRADAKRIGAGVEWALSTRGRSWAEIGDFADTRIEEVSQKFANQFTRVTGMATWNSTLKFLATALEQDSILKHALGGKLSKGDVIKLAESGIDEAMLARIGEQFRKFGETHGIRRGRTALWNDKEAATALEQALLKQSDIVVLSPGRGDNPLFMSNELFKTLFQFKGFGMAAVNRLLIPAAQGMARGDLKMLNGMMLMLGLGSLSYIAKQFTADQSIELTPGRLMAEAVDKSGFSAYLSDPYDIAADIAGLPRLSRFSDRSWIETAAGPALGTAVDIGMALKGMAKDGVSQKDIHKIRKLLPYQNLWYARRAINWMEDSTVDALGIPRQ